MSVVGTDAPIEVGEIPDEDWMLAYRRHFKVEEIGRRLVVVPEWELDGAKRKTSDGKRQMVVLAKPLPEARDQRTVRHAARRRLRHCHSRQYVQSGRRP